MVHAANISFRITDYSTQSLNALLSDCDGIVVAVQDDTMGNVDLHLAILEACKNLKTCKRFIPSEYIGNVEDFPDQPAFYVANHQPIRDALARQNAVEWTLVNPGWLSDYLVPAKHRYIRDIDECYPVDFKKQTMIIPGTGNEPITCTAVRDMAAAIAKLFTSSHSWPKATYLSGQDVTWNDVRDMLQSEGHELAITYQSFTEIEEAVAKPKSEYDVLVAEFMLWSASGSTRVPEGKAAEHKKLFFSDLHIRSIQELFDASKNPAIGAV